MRSFVSLALLVGLATTPLAAASALPAADSVRDYLNRATAWQMAHPSGTDTRHWVIAPLYDGLVRAAQATGDANFLAPVVDLGERSGWLPGDRIYHADDHAVGHAWLDIYQMNTGHPERLAPIKACLDLVINERVTEALDFRNKPTTPGVDKTDRWTWCDALYMAPPTLARLYSITGDVKYLAFLDEEYRYTYDQLWDPEEKLFFRDTTFFDRQTPSGAKIFWSRGNGWVYGGLALMLEYLPADHATRPFYETIFRDMTQAILAAQQPSGLWHPSLLDPTEIDVGETSGSGFFVFGLAWGINHGLIDRATHLPALLKGWHGLTTRIGADGHVGYVQPIGSAPDKVGPASTHDYGTGAFLLAASELLVLVDGRSTKLPAQLLAEAETLLAADAMTSRAVARLVPARKDDVAWENDKVAFRMYGPALRAGPEDSGIDAWTKRVPYPVMAKWYDGDLQRNVTYHIDHGEGYDNYHVGDSRGCGGSGLWIDGQLVTADTYQWAKIRWTGPDVAQIHALYLYPLKWDGKPLYEHRITTLRRGERLNDIEVFFSHSRSHQPSRLETFNLPVAIGLVTQGKTAVTSGDAKTGILTVYEPFGPHRLGTGVMVDPASIISVGELPAYDPEAEHRHALVVVRPDTTGTVRYRAGFAWSDDGEITTADAWRDYLAAPR